MKNIILAVTVTVAIFASTGAFARGFSVGVLGSYAVDNGAIEKSSQIFTNSIPPIIPSGERYNYKSPEVAGIVTFLQYDFKTNFFIRTGFETNFIMNGGTYKFGTEGAMPTYDDNELNYRDYTVPLYLGINLSPDRGRTSVYAAVGIYASKIEIHKKEFNEQFGANHNQFYKEMEDNVNLFGLSGIIGFERLILSRIYLVIEYAVYSGEKSKIVAKNIKHYENGVFLGSFEERYMEQFGLPSQQLRLGLKYNF